MDWNRQPCHLDSSPMLELVSERKMVRTTIAAKTDIVVGRATTWPTICSRWLRPNRVKSGMLSESVAQ